LKDTKVNKNIVNIYYRVGETIFLEIKFLLHK